MYAEWSAKTTQVVRVIRYTARANILAARHHRQFGTIMWVITHDPGVGYRRSNAQGQ